MTFADGEPDFRNMAGLIPLALSTPQTQPPYSFRVYKPQKLVMVTICGFWSQATLTSFSAELRRAIQGQDILSGFRELIVSGPTRADKLAMWTTSPLSRMQSRRLLDSRPDMAVFDNEADAKRWLRSSP